MAVEIPVVIDIDQAFKDAAKRVGVAMEPLQKTVSKLTEDLSAWTSILNDVEIGGDSWIVAAKNIQGISEKLSQADYQLKRYTSNEGSLKQMSIDLAELNRRWESMGAAQKFTSTGELTAEAKAMIDDYRTITGEISKQGRSLQQILAEEQRIDALKKKGISTRKYENAILSSTAKTMRVLQEQERILSERLSRSTVGSSKYEQLKTQLQGVRVEIEKINNDIKGVNPALDRTDSKLGSLIKNSIRLVALHTGTRFIRNIREVTAEFELQRVALGSIIQDSQRAQDIFRQIKTAAIESPFEIKDLVSYTKQLSAYQIETDKLFDTTKKLADVSAGLGVDMGRLILAYGQVRSASVLRGQELRQFTEAGVPLVDKLAEKFTDLRGETVKTGEVFQLISERAVSFKMIEEIFDEMTSAGGVFYKMQEKQAQTLAGQWANLKDSVSIMYDEIGNTSVVHGAMETLISSTKSVMENWRSWYNVVKIVGSGLLSYYGIAKLVSTATTVMAAAETKAAAAETMREKNMRRFVTSLLGKTAAEKISTAGTNAYVWAAGKAAIANSGLTKTFWNLTAAMMSNPFGIIAVAVGSLIGLFSILSQKTRDIEKDIMNANKSIDALNKSRVETAQLIDSYEELSSKTDLTAKEQAKLRDISKELSKTFPKATQGINEQTGALSLNIEKLRQYNAEAESAIKKGMEAQIRVDEKTIKKNNKEIEDAARDINRGFGRNKVVTLLAPSLANFTPLSDKQTSELSERMQTLQEENMQLTESIENMRKALDGTKEDADDTSEGLLSWQEKLMSFSREINGTIIRILDPEQIKQFSSLDGALDEIAKKYGEYEEQVKKLEAALKDKNGEEAKDILISLERAKARKELAKEELDYYNAFFLTTKKTTSTADHRLQDLKNNISEIANAYKKFDELKKYKSEAESLLDIGTLFPQLSGWAPTFQNTISKLEAMLDDVKKQLAKRPKDTVLLDMQRALETEISNLNFDKLKQDLDNSLKRLSEEIKRSEAARDFYQSVLNLTGNDDLATTMSISVYGGIGEDFKERLQKQLDEALLSLDATQITDDLRAAFASRDFDTILANLDKFPEVWQQKLREMAESSQKFDADRAMDLLKSLEKAKTYGEERVKLAEETARRMKDIEEMNVPQPVKDQLQKQSRKKEAEAAAKLEYEAFKDTPMYIELFADLDSASVQMLTNMRENLVSLKSEWSDLAPTELKELQSRINELDEQLASRNPFKALVSSVKEYRDMQASMPRSEVDMNVNVANNRLIAERQILDDLTKQYEEKVKQYGIDSSEAIAAKEAMEIQAGMTDLAKDEAESAQEIANEYSRAARQVMAAAEGLQKWADYANTALDGAKEIIDTFASDDFSETFGIIAEGTAQTLQGAGETASGLAKILTGADIAGGIMDLLSGISDLVVGIGGTTKKLNIQQLNKQIKEQGRIIGNLEESYESLSKALDHAFGNERVYNFNKMMEVMAAEMEAYRKQAEAERAKGKKADEETALGYEKSARELDERMRDLRDRQDAFFAGADLASTAESFADAWLSAYQEFGDTSTAIEERMTEMVQTLVKKAALSGIAENILGNWYTSLSDVKDWNAQTIAEKWKEAMELVNPMVEGMQVFANSMQSEGISLRNTVGQFTGISRDIAGASEESINGLAAGINTQNFYMSFMPLLHENVAQILTLMSGGATVTPATDTGIEGMPSVQKMVYDHLPYIDANINSLLQLMKSVISPKSAATATHYVSVK